MPNTDAVTLYTTMENSAAHRAISASWVSPPKSTMLLMVDATELLICVITRTPRKLNTALSRMAGRGAMHRVVIQVAMALGASVHPLTKMTPSVRTTVIKSTGLCDMALTKYENDTSIYDTCLALGRKPPGPVGTGNGAVKNQEGRAAGRNSRCIRTGAEGRLRKKRPALRKRGRPAGFN